MFETIILWLLLKHFVIDFVLQTPYMYLNKGTYGHWGGILHAGLHGVGTQIVLTAAGMPAGTAITLGLVDAVAHYHIDWAKVKITKANGWTATNSEQFWWLLGFDQLLHQFTYIIIAKLAL